MLQLLGVFSLLVIPSALAQEPASSESTGTVMGPSTPKPVFELEVGLRVRRMSLPRGLFNSWYSNSDSDDWALPGQDRPSIGAWAYGMEFVIRSNRASGIFWFEWIDSTMDEGYWDRKEKSNEIPDPTNGIYIRPTSNFGLVSFGADYALEIPMVKMSRTDNIFEMGFVVGAGAGAAIVVGSLDQWATVDDIPGYILYGEGADPLPVSDSDIPRAFPILDFNLGFRLNFADRVVVRLEGGLHTMLYYGASAGFMF